ncbi:hypothetical protein [Campylobacter geochelonis]|uniref:hypothetical protein n=1 Tax=Campylobacter geochelonis TaxID=1780362 RepID=UPI000770866E|nr:hypothetical protein [Campylobacter geochelonis]CZE50526.1 Uncharacterized lipoprotein [Campylobacter geochelonis]
MKKIISILALALFIVGCSQKNSMISLGSYDTFNAQNKLEKSVYISEVTQSVENPNIIATIRDKDGLVDDYILVSENVASWYKQALEKELQAQGVAVLNSSENADAVASVNITKFIGNLQGFDKENMKGDGEVFIKIYKGKTTFSKRVAQSQSEFVVIKDAKAFDPFMKNLLRDLVKKSAKQIENSL